MQRGAFDWVRKLGAIVLVLTSATAGITGLGMLVQYGRWWGLPLMVVTPVGIWLATRLTPEGGTSGYCDDNL